MGIRGKKSVSELSVVATAAPGQRPEPPNDLTAEQAEEWRAIVSRMPVGWFTRETHGLLSQLCRHICRSRVVAAQLNAISPDSLEDRAMLARFDKLTVMAERESRAMSALALRMRLTQSSRYTDKAAGTAVRHETNGTRPWQRSA